MSETTAINLCDALCSGQTTALAVINAAFDEITRKDPQLKAFIETTPETARADAIASDARRLAGNSLIRHRNNGWYSSIFKSYCD